MAGADGFEPSVHGIKTRCLTTWLHPNYIMVIYQSLLRQNQTIVMAIFHLLSMHLFLFQRLQKHNIHFQSFLQSHGVFQLNLGELKPLLSPLPIELQHLNSRYVDLKPIEKSDYFPLYWRHCQCLMSENFFS